MARQLTALFSLLLASSALAACGSCPDGDVTRQIDISRFPVTCGPDGEVQASGSDASAGPSDASTSDAGTSADGGGDAGTGARACTCEALCRHYNYGSVASCRFVSATMLECNGSQMCIGGRKPSLLVAPRLPLTDRRTAFLLGCAHMEAASVVAFERLACEMAALGAPAALLDRLHAAAADEVRHARDMLALAGDHALPRVDAPSSGPRSVLGVALENAREGCVRETFAALVAHRQAITARDPAVRLVMMGIAADETRHAELSWDLAAWLDERLDAGERLAIADARSVEAAALRSELTARGLLEDADLGLPGAAEAVALLDGLFADLSRAAA